MIIIIDDTTVAVDTAADLKTVLEGINAYTLIYLSNDIQLTTGITILPSKSTITIDGFYPLDGSGITHTITDMPTASIADTIGVRSASSIAITLKNMNIVGNNYYGIVSINDGSVYSGTSLTFDHVTYVGPQMNWTPDSLTRYLDCDITIKLSTACEAQEIGEVNRVEIGGITTIHHNADIAINACFWFKGSAGTASFTVLSGADVSVTSTNYFCYTNQPIGFTVQQNAKIVFKTEEGMFYNSAHEAAFVLVDSNATLHIIQNTYNGGTATFYCDGAFTVNEGADLYMQANFANAAPLVYFSTSSASLTLNNPKSAVFYSSDASAFYFTSSTPISILGGQINYWLIAKPIASAGALSDVPLYSWRKQDRSTAQIAGNCTNTTTTTTSNNFTAAELASLPPLSSLQMRSAHVLSIGNLPLVLDPITDDQYPFEGNTSPAANVSVVFRIVATDYSLIGAAGDTGKFSIVSPVAVPAGTTVTVAVNVPFLITTIIAVSVSAGELNFSSRPELIWFNMTPISTSPVVLLGRGLPDLPLIVDDTRVRSTSWYLTAQVNTPLTTIQGHTLPDALVFADSEGVLHILSDQPTEVYIGESSGGIAETTTIIWAFDKGILLQVTGTPFHNGEEYSTNIYWVLNANPT